MADIHTQCARLATPLATPPTIRCPSGRHSHTGCPSGNPSNHNVRLCTRPSCFLFWGAKKKSEWGPGNTAVLCTNRHPLYPQQCNVSVMWLDFWVSKYENVLWTHRTLRSWPLDMFQAPQIFTLSQMFWCQSAIGILWSGLSRIRSRLLGLITWPRHGLDHMTLTRVWSHDLDIALDFENFFDE